MSKNNTYKLCSDGIIREKLTYDKLKVFLDNFEPVSIAWNLEISPKGIENAEGTTGIFAWCSVNSASITQKGMVFQK